MKTSLFLIDHFVKHFARKNRKEIKGVSREARDLLIKYHYPGNVRELENIIERAIVIARGAVLSVEDLPFQEALSSNATCSNDAGARKELLRRTLRMNGIPDDRGSDGKGLF